MTRAESSAPVAGDWRDTLRDAADLALIGILVTLAAAPVLTAGAAAATAAAAIRQRFTEGHWPGLGELLRTFGRRLLPGAAATLAVLSVFALLVFNLLLLRGGAVPGGTAPAWLTGGVLLALAGLLALATTQLGHGYGFRAALLSSLRLVRARPVILLAACGILLLAALLASILPVTGPLLVGYVLFAVYAVVRRLS